MFVLNKDNKHQDIHFTDFLQLIPVFIIKFPIEH